MASDLGTLRRRATALSSWPEASGVFAGFAAGWIVQENLIEETPYSNRFGYVSDVCVLPAFRGRRIAALLLEAIEARLSLGGVKGIRLSALAANRAAGTAYERSGYVAYEIVYEKAARHERPLSHCGGSGSTPAQHGTQHATSGAMAQF